MNMNDEESGKTNHIDVEASDNSEQGEKFSVRLLWILLISLILASVSTDPLFFYISVINNDSNCLQSDDVLKIIVVVLRTFADGAYLTLWWRRMLASPSSLQGPRERTCFRVRKTKTIYFLLVDVLAFLPLPQVVVYAVSWRLLSVKLLKFIVLVQIVPKVYLTLATYKYARKCYRGVINMTFAAAFYFLMFILAGDVLGAFWYLRAIERNMDCWHKACKIRGLCGVSSLYCGGNSSNNKYLDEFCPIPPSSNSTFFDYGIYLDAFQRNIMGMRTNFINKVYYCTWWGLLSLSSFGQNLNPGTYIWDNIFSTFIVISGLLLFALLIGNMQVYLQKKASSDADKQEREDQSRKEMKSMMVQMENEMQETMKRMENEKQERMARMKSALDLWRPFLSLPLPLRNAIASCENENWLGTTNINLQSLLKNLPSSIGREIKLHFCKELFSKVEKFEKLDPTIKTELRERVKPVVFEARSIIHAEGYPIHEMIHIVHGKALAFNKDSNMNEGLQLFEYILEGNDPIGKELLDRSLESPEPFLPLATETVMALTTVEAFTLSFDDFASVFTRHGRLIDKAYEEECAVRAITAALRKKSDVKKYRRETGNSEGNDTVTKSRLLPHLQPRN